MKKLTLLAIAFVAFALVACKGSKDPKAEEKTEPKSFEQEQVEAKIKQEVDSIAALVGKLKQFPFVQEGTKFELTKEEKQVQPDYLLDAAVAEQAQTLAEKYRILSALSVDKKIAALYDMPVDAYDKAIAKLSADIDDPSFKVIDQANSLFETTDTLYKTMEQNGRINQFWQLASAGLVEQLFVMNKNAEKFLTVFDDQAASDVTYRIVLVLDALDRLTQYDPEVKPVAEALVPLKELNATSVKEFKDQLAKASDKIDAARKALIK
ncbi:MAG: hypothetical protein J5548_00360 [Prevotella sp.]|nr:hypothetical protein [Prevotella sp.]